MRRASGTINEAGQEDPFEETAMQSIVTISFIVLLLVLAGVLFYFILHTR